MATRNSEVEDLEIDGEEEEEGLDLQKIKNLVGFFLRAPRRRPKLAAIVFVSVTIVSILAAFFLPRSYTSDVRILAQKPVITPALVTPNRAIPRDAEDPKAHVQETILRRDNIIALIKQVNLVDRWDSARPPALRFKDKIMESITRPLTEEERLRALIGMLEQRLWITTDESSFTITVDWPNPEMAFELVTLVQKNFFDARYDGDINEITDAIALLDKQAKAEAENVDAALSELNKLQDARRQAILAAAQVAAQQQAASHTTSTGYVPRRSRTMATTGSASDADVQELEEVRKDIKRIEDDRAQRLNQAQSQLADAQVTMGPLHPTVVALKQKIEAMSAPSPELADLKAQEHALIAKIATAQAAPAPAPQAAPAAAPVPQHAAPQGVSASPGGAAPAQTAASGIGAPGAPSPQEAALTLLSPRDQDDGPTTLARSRLLSAAAKYNDLLGRLDNAKSEMELRKANFKYVYSVLRPAELPSKPRKPNVKMLLVGGFAGAILLALILAGIADMAAGRFIERWQVEDQLKIPVLGALPPPQ